MDSSLVYITREILFNILLRVDLFYLLNICSAGKEINNICDDEYFWKKRLQLDYPNSYSKIYEELKYKSSEPYTWRKYYIQLYVSDIIIDDVVYCDNNEWVDSEISAIIPKFPLYVYEIEDNLYDIYPDVLAGNKTIAYFDRDTHKVIDSTEGSYDTCNDAYELEKEGYRTYAGPIDGYFDEDFVMAMVKYGLFKIISKDELLTPNQQIEKFMKLMISEDYD